MYAEVAVDVSVRGTFHYHIPPELDGKIAPGHLVEVSFGTAVQPGIVLALHPSSPIEQTKPIRERLDPRPVVTDEQIDLALWMSQTYAAPISACLWLMLPPGIAGSREVQFHLLDEEATSNDEIEQALIEVLNKRSPLRAAQITQKLVGKNWRAAADALVKAKVIEKEHRLTPPKVKPKVLQTIELAIPGEDVAEVSFGKPRAGSEKLFERLRHILRVLAREGRPVDVSVIYAQTGASQPDIKKLESLGLIRPGEQEVIRSSLADRDFVAVMTPKLTPEQARVWERVEKRIVQFSPPLNPLPVHGEGKPNSSASEKTWPAIPQLSQELVKLAREKRHEPTPAEETLWQRLRRNRMGYHFRRQHPIERFIVDFYCGEARLIVEVDGEIHQYTQDEDAIRQQLLESQDYRVIRFSNEQVLRSIDNVIDQINQALTAPTDKSDSSPQLRESDFSPFSVYGEGLGEGKFLLHGVTGSGKTEIYLRAIEATLAQGRQAIFLVPEIALTAQTVRRVAARFPGQVALTHGGLSDGERYDTWRRARDGQIQVIVGSRSALFAPLPDVGLVILDEEHDHSYKQSPPFNEPHYHARQVAEEMMDQNDGVVILGSATPDVETYYRAQQGELEYLSLPRRIMGHRVRIEEQADREGVTPRYKPESEDAMMIGLPPVSVVDMREELKSGNTGMFSRELHTALETVLSRHEQAILFLNRRGHNSYVFCRDCGYIAICPRCDTPLTFHTSGEKLRCHHCGYQQNPPTQCPICKSARIRYFGAGTQQVEAELRRLFPNARPLRWDADTATTHDAHDGILQRFIDRKADVLIGTQMIAKGLDLPLVTLVGVISADLGLALPDFRAGERTFQLLTQVAGRAGRGLLGGQVVLQTYQPGHYAVAAAAQHDYGAFYEREIAFRHELGYPPYRRLMRIVFRFPNELKAQFEAERAAEVLRHRLSKLKMTGTQIIGPAPCFFNRLDRIYRWQVILRGPNPAAVLEVHDDPALDVMDIGRGWHVDIDPVDLL